MEPMGTPMRLRHKSTCCDERMVGQTSEKAGAHNVPNLKSLLLGGSWVVISGVITRVTIVITHINGLITLLITTHEPLSRCSCFRPTSFVVTILRSESKASQQRNDDRKPGKPELPTTLWYP